MPYIKMPKKSEADYSALKKIREDLTKEIREIDPGFDPYLKKPAPNKMGSRDEDTSMPTSVTKYDIAEILTDEDLVD